MAEITTVVGLKSPLLGRGVSATLSDADDMAVLDVTAAPEATLDAVARYEPDVAILDVRFHREDAGFVEAVACGSPGTRIVFIIDHDESQCPLFRSTADPGTEAALGMYLERDCCLAAIRDGAGGCCWSESPPEKLLATIRTVASGRLAAERWLDAEARHRVSSIVSPNAVAPKLTPRQEEVVDLVARGLSNAEIGERLGLAEQTVKNHLTRAMRVLGARNRVEVACSFVRMYRAPGWSTSA